MSAMLFFCNVKDMGRFSYLPCCNFKYRNILIKKNELQCCCMMVNMIPVRIQRTFQLLSMDS